MNTYRPEGCLFKTVSNQNAISSAGGLREAMEKGIILEARAAVCDNSHNLIADLPCGRGIIPRKEGAVGIDDGTTRDIALISRVNKTVCFKVLSVSELPDGSVSAVLSRKAAQEECIENYVSRLNPGDIIGAKVTHLEQFGCFVDIACGLPSLIPIDMISVSRIAHPSDRFAVGDEIKAVVKSCDGARVCLTHKELLGTWEENAEGFRAGETVSGVVRSVEEYGIFVELAPNLAGLAEPKEGIFPGQSISVYIKAIIPEKMKIKLIIVDVCDETEADRRNNYFIGSGHLERWEYAPECSKKSIGTYFG